MAMKLSPQGYALIKKWEGLRLTAYRDAAGVWTIGYGHTRTAVQGMRITADKANDLLEQDVARFVRRVNEHVKVSLTQSQFDALVSFDFNTGRIHNSTLLKKLNAGQYDLVDEELMRWVYAGGRKLRGLTRRRLAETAMWNEGTFSDVSVNDTPEQTNVIAERRKPPKRITESKTAASGALVAVSSAIGIARQVSEDVASIVNDNGIMVLLVMCVVAGVFVIWDRNRKLKEGLV